MTFNDLVRLNHPYQEAGKPHHWQALVRSIEGVVSVTNGPEYWEGDTTQPFSVMTEDGTVIEPVSAERVDELLPINGICLSDLEQLNEYRDCD